MRRATLGAVALAVVTMFGATVPAAAQIPANWNNVPKILLHITAPSTKSQCTTWFTNTMTTCSQARTSADLGDYFIYVVVAKGDSVLSLAGLEFGITYNTAMLDHAGIDIFGWTLCGTLEFQQPSPVWPNPGGGNLITWDWVNSCQTGEVADAGYFYVSAYSADTMKITFRPVSAQAKIADCTAAETAPLPEGALGWVSFSPGNATPGCNPCLAPCGIIPVEQTTWSGIKSMYKQ